MMIHGDIGPLGRVPFICFVDIICIFVNMLMHMSNNKPFTYLLTYFYDILYTRLIDG